MTVREQLESALAHHRARRFSEAEQIYRDILVADPNEPDALHLLGLLIHKAGRHADGIPLVQRAIALRPDNATYHFNLAIALNIQKQYDQAIFEFTQAIKFQPHYPEAHYYLGKIYTRLEQWDNAIKHFQQSLSLDHNSPRASDIMNRLAYALTRAGRSDEAISTYQSAILLDPNSAKSYMNLAGIYYTKYKLELAIENLRRALELKPDFDQAAYTLATALKDIGDHAGALEYFDKTLEIRPDYAEAASARIYLLTMMPDSTPQSLLAEQKKWNDRFATHLFPKNPPRREKSVADRRLRIGYVSGDFRNHVVARNILPLLRDCNRREFEIFCYSASQTRDSMTNLLRSNADNWRNIFKLSDEAAAQQIRTDQIHILVDLSLHTPANRLLIFARKPAAVQITFAGYPAGTGLSTVDYRFTDSWLDPPGSDANYTEKTYRLPNTFWCYDPSAMQWESGAGKHPDISSLPALKNGHITFGCLNNFPKVNEKVLALFSRVLATIKNSQLIMLAPEGSARKRVIDHFQSHGIDSHRIEFILHQSRPKYFAQFNQIDLALDTFPYNGHTSSLDALWMGVPVISLIGETAVARAGLSQATNLGLTDFVAHTEDQFLQIAVQATSDLSRLVALRRSLRNRMLSSPLCASRCFVEDIEKAYQKIWNSDS